MTAGGRLKGVPLLSLELLLRPATDLGLLLGPLAFGIMVSFPSFSFPVGVGVGAGVWGSDSELSIGIFSPLVSRLCLLGWLVSLVIVGTCKRGIGMVNFVESPRAVVELLGSFSSPRFILLGHVLLLMWPIVLVRWMGVCWWVV